MATTIREERLSEHGIEPTGTVHWNPSTSKLYTDALARGEGRLAEGGPLAVDTGKHTGRSPKDKFVVREPGSEDRIWWGDVNAGFSEEHFEGLREKVTAHIGGGDDLYVIDAFAGADPKQRIAVRVVTSYVGYTADTRSVSVPAGPLALDVALTSSAVEAPALTVTARAVASDVLSTPQSVAVVDARALARDRVRRAVRRAL